jgi:hypothetical protein
MDASGLLPVLLTYAVRVWISSALTKRRTASDTPVINYGGLMRFPKLWQLGYWYSRGYDWRHVPAPNWRCSRRINPLSVYW